MKERPILFNDEMVRALLEGRKTQTRRLVKPQPAGEIAVSLPDGWGFDLVTVRPGRPQRYHETIRCPYGQPGDRLWVRETWWQAGDRIFTYPEDDEGVWSGSRRVHYAADGEPPNEPNRDYPDGLRNGQFSAAEPHRLWRKRPSIHMPRWACRLLLEVTAVRVERLQDITEADAQAEGASVATFPNVDDQRTDRDRFRAMWNHINGSDAWDANAWVWVVEFKRIDAQQVAA